MIACFVVITGLLSLRILVTVAEQESIRWIPSVEFAMDLTIPAGYERSNSSDEYLNLYVARARNLTNWIPGKYSPEQRKCFVGINGREIEKFEGECELLVFPKGTTSWIYTSTHDSLPAGLLLGDKSLNLSLCRARKEGQVLLGWLSALSSKKHCYTTSNGVEYKHREYEVLAQNFMTKVTGTVVQD